MKLVLQRVQEDKKGLFGGHKGVAFGLTCRVELTDEEQALVKRYRAEHHPLTWKDDKGVRVPSVTVSILTTGVSYQVGDVTTLLQNEDVIKGACQDFKMLLDVMQSFGGEEVIEF